MLGSPAQVLQVRRQTPTTNIQEDLMQLVPVSHAHAPFSALQGNRTALPTPCALGAAYTLRVLQTPQERAAIAGLRRHAPMGVEDDLGAGLMPFETIRDEVGVVTALYRDAMAVATMRFVPSGHELTAAERLEAVAKLPAIAGPHNWEVGRLIVDPDERSFEQLQRCLSLALRALMQQRQVEHFYAIATTAMARLWRRFGMHRASVLRGASGREFLLVCGHVSDVAQALEVPLRQSSMPASTTFC
jgi:predicted GNAT family N-acyltransferase